MISRFRASYLTQFIWLFWRQLLSMLREPLATRILMAQSIVWEASHLFISSISSLNYIFLTIFLDNRRILRIYIFSAWFWPKGNPKSKRSSLYGSTPNLHYIFIRSSECKCYFEAYYIALYEKLSFFSSLEFSRTLGHNKTGRQKRGLFNSYLLYSKNSLRG